ncbi:hypothetical protein [Undibacterium curvum]|uniref:DUF4234 domain-containing protein n=1 Tax=Undibacterium curvum TaxID=2762294 RepID=A0ABR7A8X8_9BURK|nr:hypothetical protein [Undibacterium curvum]MBC3933334.1 hypothetical protein [Undibacterium curvum]
MTLATMGLYATYWFYRNWRAYRESTGDNIWPVARAIFSIFFTHALLREIADSRPQLQQLRGWNHRFQAHMIVLLTILMRIFDRMAGKGIGVPVTDLLSLALLIPFTMFLVQVQSNVNLAMRDPEGQRNARFGVANVIWIALGILLWMSVLQDMTGGFSSGSGSTGSVII